VARGIAIVGYLHLVPSTSECSILPKGLIASSNGP